MSAIAVDRGLLRTEGERFRWLSGSVHYWRHDPRDWERVLDGVLDLGLNMIDTYVPWEVHERADGSLDFSGALDVARFLELAHARGLRASIRPGPACGAELATHGYPRHIVSRPECQGLRCSGRPYILPSASHFFPVPSYASSAFRAEVRRWYTAVGQRLAGLQAPHGPIVAVQVDNEMGFFFQAHAFALDYHPEAIAAWRAFVLELHGSLDAVNRAYGTNAANPEGLEPPRDGSDPSELRRLEWVLFREHHLRETLSELAGELRESGFEESLLFHNDYARTETPMDQRALEAGGAIQVAGVDAYSSRKGGRWITDVARHVATTSRLPHFPELGSGWISLPWLIPAGIRATDQEMVTMAAFLAGAQGGNFYMLADRDRWYGSPLDNGGSVREPHASFFRRFTAFVAEARLDELERETAVLLLEPRAELRREAARAVLGDIVPAYREVMPFELGLGDPGAVAGEARRWQRALRQVIREAGLDCGLAVSASPPPLAQYAVVAVPVLELLDAAAVDTLAAAAERGVRVCAGPSLPRADERLAPLARAPQFTRLHHPSDLAAYLPTPGVEVSDAAVEVFRWRGPDREVVGLLNQSDAEVRVTTTVKTAARWRALWPVRQATPGETRTTHDTTLPAYGAAVWELAA